MSATNSAFIDVSLVKHFTKLRARAISVALTALSYNDDGTVTDQSGEHLGNIYDELHKSN
jgi:hypothetical protein